MSAAAFVKKYPRAKVSRHPKINGWVIDLFQREGARPKRVAATYATVAFADRAARVKLGITAPAVFESSRTLDLAPSTPDPARIVRLVPVRQATATTPRTRAPHGEQGPGTCTLCSRPMRPAASKAVDYPGTALRQREGLCQSCYKKAKHEEVAA